MHPKRNPDVKTTVLPDGHVVLFSAKNNWAHTLNPMGALVWEFCDGESTVEEIVFQVSGLIETVEGRALKNEVEALLGELVESGLVEQ